MRHLKLALASAFILIIMECGSARNVAFAETVESCRARYNRCLNGCARRGLTTSCVRNCNTAASACDKRIPVPRRPLPLDRGDTTPKPRGKPGEAAVPPIGGGILDAGQGFNPQGPAGTGAPLGAGGGGLRAPAQIR